MVSWSRRIWLGVGGLMALGAVPARADISVDGDRLSVTSANLTVQFRGGDVIGIRNRWNGAHWAGGISGRLAPLCGLEMLDGPGALKCNGWRLGKANAADADAAQTTFNDLVRTVWMNVKVDGATQDVTVGLWGEATREGAVGTTFAVRNLDLTSGRLIVPARGGAEVGAAELGEEVSFDYPGEWQAQMAIWQDKDGGLVIYSRDEECRLKRLRIRKRGDRADLLLETRAPAPFSRAGGVPFVEWRLNSFKGEWRVPADGYRALMQHLRPAHPLRGVRLWAEQVTGVKLLAGTPSRSVLAKLAEERPPARTVLYLPDWRAPGYAAELPAQRALDWVRPFADRAHELGFFVMLPVEAGRASTSAPNWPGIRAAQVRDERSGDTPIVKDGVAPMQPADRAWSNALIAALQSVVQETGADALLLTGASECPNDGGGVRNSRNTAQGIVALHRAILTAMPEVVLGCLDPHELLAPYARFVAHSRGRVGRPHPISRYLFDSPALTFDLSGGN